MQTLAIGMPSYYIPHENAEVDLMGTWNGQKLAGAAGILFVVATLASAFIVSPPPSADESPAKFLEFYSDHRSALLAQAIIGVLAIIPAFLFTAGLLNLLRTGEKEGGILAAAAVLSFIAAGAMALLVTAWFGGLAYMSDGNGLDEGAAKTLSVLAGFMNQGFFAPLALTNGASGYLLLKGSTVPKWVGWIGLLAAALAFVAVFSVAQSGAFTPFGVFSFGAFLSFSLYVVLVSLFMWRRG
ncbi:MAG: DUF4386 family protein [Anaerolineaceae bacterium]